MIALVFMAVTIIGGVAYGYSLLSKLNSNDFSVKAINYNTNEPINTLVVGMDIEDTENLSNKSARRTDSIMVVNYNPLNND